ncbi:heterokaryon incompatibility protein-domain-containing protein [Paraphoma chrysanthemicola]|uniref:Heterokaryon incompatibility protein-domain-containing protein n=1 Tax=Paraphoma chrysanthemicola TaxID=798071 RepID=A0A8K0RFB9_9PLEO|nr:heterokaryon incompatibility protein-domain-containing protein [Paraphoma chrysanthemicola]
MEGFWDSRSPRPSTKVVKTINHAIQRGAALREFNLLYEYTRIEPDEIRLLFILPAMKHEMDVQVVMNTYKDIEVGPDLQEYEALSYHWGPGPADKPIWLSYEEDTPQETPKHSFISLAVLEHLVRDHEKGKRLYVRPNLDKALRYLRSKTRVVALWVDAVCINQSDEKIEKPAQIRKMKHIYNKASNVCIWLGDGKIEGKEDRSQDFHAAMDFSKKIIQLKELEGTLQNANDTKSWSNFLDLIRCSWFSRRWVIQELALARDASVHCGDKHIPWLEFADAIGLFALNFDRIRALFRQSREDAIYRNYKNFDELAPLGAKVLVDAITNAFRKHTDDSMIEPVFDLETLVSSLCSFESSDPRDTIFALLNIATESLNQDKYDGYIVKPPKPNYEKDILEVYTDFLVWVVATTDSLDIICRQWAIPEREKAGGRKNPTPLIALPSWIQTITKSPWGYQEQGFNGRINGDSIVGKAGRRRYNASRWKKPEVRFGHRTPIVPKEHQVSRTNSAPVRLPRDGDFASTSYMPRRLFGRTSSSHELSVTGIEIGIVNWDCGPVSRGVVTKECLERGGWKNYGRDLTKVPDKLWRTLVADRNAEGDNPPPWYHRAALHCMALADNNGDIATHELLDPGTYAHDKQPQIVTEYLKRVQAVSWNRKFLEAKPHEVEPLFGLGPPDTVRGDRICVLFGCSVPCVLRPLQHGNGCYSFVGEAYVYGRMDGEAIAALSAEELQRKTKEFIIV